MRRAKGEYLPLASPERLTTIKARIAQNRARLSVGTPETVLAKLGPLIESNKADELTVTAMIFDHVACSVHTNYWQRPLPKC